jgi:chromosome segregation ATPase
VASIEVPSDLNRLFNPSEFANEFRNKFRRLGDLKQFRTEYEKKNAFIQWWDNNELEDAQLKAQELQADFSRMLGQLMLISVQQSKELQEQQTWLSQQQKALKHQADEIAQHTETLRGQHKTLRDQTQQLDTQQTQLSSQQDKLSSQQGEIKKQTEDLESQHKELHEQSQKLEKLVNEYFELRGLTQDGAKKLIAIANDVKETSGNLRAEFAEKSSALEKLVNDYFALRDETLRNQTQQLDEQQAQLSSQQDEIKQHTEDLAIQHEKLHEQSQELENLVKETSGNLQVEIVEKSSALEKLVNDCFALRDETMRQHTEGMAIQHEKLHKQSQGLEKLVDDYSDLRSLTQDGAKKLVAITDEIRGTRENLINRFKSLKIALATITIIGASAMAYVFVSLFK